MKNIIVAATLVVGIAFNSFGYFHPVHHTFRPIHVYHPVRVNTRPVTTRTTTTRPVQKSNTTTVKHNNSTHKPIATSRVKNVNHMTKHRHNGWFGSYHYPYYHNSFVNNMMWYWILFGHNHNTTSTIETHNKNDVLPLCTIEAASNRVDKVGFDYNKK